MLNDSLGKESVYYKGERKMNKSKLLSTLYVQRVPHGVSYTRTLEIIL